MDKIVLFDFTTTTSNSPWQVINDGVMGGRSKSDFSLSKSGHGIFKGQVSLENNGGFCSIRLQMKKIDITGSTKVFLRIKGDNKRYQFRLKPNTNDYYNYIAYFDSGSQWETIQIALKDFYPNFRGRKLDMSNFDHQQLTEIGFLIGNKKAERFTLEIDAIWLE
ncbi:CIA30 family protein [uncultured Croceitalea sp.]|uniref:CIA30 family protein n=1 Tax=uncultured Croceitalea sp. TaxID=1798908 RepID=UPI0033067851